jgi:Flp pilus assembly protein TadB
MTLIERFRHWFNVGTVHTVVTEERIEESVPVEQKIMDYRQPAMTLEERVEKRTEHHVQPDGMGLQRSMARFLRRAFLVGLAAAALVAAAVILLGLLD